MKGPARFITDSIQLRPYSTGHTCNQKNKKDEYGLIYTFYVQCNGLKSPREVVLHLLGRFSNHHTIPKHSLLPQNTNTSPSSTQFIVALRVGVVGCWRRRRHLNFRFCASGKISFENDYIHYGFSRQAWSKKICIRYNENFDIVYNSQEEKTDGYANHLYNHIYESSCRIAIDHK